MGPSDPREIFAFDGGKNILEESAFGIFNGTITCGIPYRDTCALGGLFAPPLTASNVVLDVRFGGERAACTAYRWYPSTVERTGSCAQCAVTSVTYLLPGERAVGMRVSVENRLPHDTVVPVLVSVRGWLDRSDAWEFQRPLAQSPLDARVVSRGLSLTNAAGALEIRSDVADCRWDAITRTGLTLIRLGAGEVRTVSVAIAVGDPSRAAASCAAIITDPAAAHASAARADNASAAELFARLPHLESDNERLVAFYNRSLLALPLHRWDVPELVLRPYYGVGSINGGVTGCYLWDFAIGARMLALYDPRALRAHILRLADPAIADSFGFNPVTGSPFGLWYAVNPEKLVLMARDYVALTADRGILAESVGEASLIDRLIACATYGDDGLPEASLVDYREEKYHLELRRGFRYDNFVPDLNGRRYAVLRAAADLADHCGRPSDALRRRASQVPSLLRERLWSPSHGWFRFIDARGGPDMRFTNEIFELVGSGVLDAGQEEAVLAHLNDDEFLSAFGMHSISKLDPAYDPEDVDHGGGGCFVGIAPGIVEKLYTAGHCDRADDLLRRILWWGERMPYWGDSLYGDRVDYRRDTPYAAALPSVAGAQAILFGMMGVSVDLDGTVTIAPRRRSTAERLTLNGVHLRGVTFDLTADGASCDVRVGTETLHVRAGETIRLNGKL